MKSLIGLLILMLIALGAGPSKAAVCGAYPFVFVNGQVANAVQVNGDFNWIQTCLNNTNVNTFAALRANTAAPPSIIVAGGTFPADGSGGLFIYNPLDTTSPDNGSTIIVDAVGHRWYRSGGSASYVVTTVANLASLPIAGFPSGIAVLVEGYYAAGDAPTVLYTLSKSACSLNSGAGDGGSQIPSTTPNNCWLIAAQKQYDIRNWGAHGDLKKILLATTTITSGNCALTVAGQNFGSADVGKNISITQAIVANQTLGSSVVAGVFKSGYQGTILAASGTALTVSAPCPTYNSSITQDVFYGHLDDAYFNAASNFLDTFQQSIGAQPILTGGGLSYGAGGPLHANANSGYVNFEWVAMVPSGFGPTTGLCSIEASFAYLENWRCDAGYLPVNAVTGNTNGTILPRWIRAVNWFGSTTNTTTFTGAHSTVAGTGTTVNITGCAGSAANGWSCTMSVGAVSAGNVQPGYGVSGAGVPDGTYVAGYADNKAVGDKGNYLIFNATANPGTLGPITATFLGFDVVVNACGTDNFNSIGLSSHGNGSLGIADRTFIVACNAGTITLNKAPTKSFTAQSPVFYQDANGFYLPRYTDPVGKTGTVGIQFDHPTTDWDQFKGDPANQYGCSIYDDSNGGSSFLTIGSFQGAGGICRGPDAAGSVYKGGVHISNLGSGQNDVNVAGVLEMDGATGGNYENINIGGQFQRFIVTGTKTPQIQTTNLGWFGNSGSAGYAPSNSMFIYTEEANTSLANVTFAPTGVSLLATTSGQPNVGTNLTLIALQTAGGTYKEFTPAQINLMSSAAAVALNNGSGPTSIPEGVDLATGPLDHAELPIVTVAAAYSFSENDCGRFFRFNTPSYTVTIPNTLGQNVSQALTKTVCTIQMYEPAAGITLTVASGATLFVAGQSVAGPVSLAAQTIYTLQCPANTTGVLAVCYLSQGTGVSKNINFSSGTLGSALTTPFAFAKISNGGLVSGLVMSANVFTCTGNPIVQLLECGTSTTCASPTNIGSVTLTAAGTATPATVSSAAIAPGDYVAGRIASGTCTALDVTVSAEMQQ
jgi:hypothetical protein